MALWDVPRIDKLITQLQSAKTIAPTDKPIVNFSQEDIIELCQQCRELFLSQPCLLELTAPLQVCGDVHGQFFDLLRMLENGGQPGTETNYLFLGDYVDRGKQSLETICLLLAYKLKFPSNFFLLRGNHECPAINRVYGFYDECKRRYSIKLWKTFTDTFNCMPIAALIDNRIFCCHGGLSPDLMKVTGSLADKINSILRPTDIPDTGLLCDLLWADPYQYQVEASPGRYITKTGNGWAANDRGVSWCFGPDVVKEFCAKFDLDLVCRAHQVVEDGYEFFADRKLITVFSAPNYSGDTNSGATLSIDADLLCSIQILKPASK